MMRVASAGLLIGAAALSAILAWEIGAFAPAQPPVAPPPHVSVAAATAPAVAPDRTNEWVNAILARPLFSPNRRPAAAGTVASATAVSGLPRLSGVLVGPFGRRAIFASDGSKPMVVGEGGQVSAWTVRAIEAGGVRLMGPGGEQVLHPSFAQSDGGASLVAPQRTGAAPPR